ncbi:MAG TPA: hypothetical protein PKN57_00900 [Saprospiraceae bacterium]|nr:hypothetical protein [Saprospiraceae bacterium]MCC6689123.1 hypothetical protein [Saprospiraceae bacterium]HMV23122.1 hypothetical protein [Saprospiraceae bacterium]HMW75199.1 hypothetical protein [Saprospiraceae bacterium]HMX83414.1 hypothetical protein [Saprospiraceae bacterium]
MINKYKPNLRKEDKMPGNSPLPVGTAKSLTIGWSPHSAFAKGQKNISFTQTFSRKNYSRHSIARLLWVCVLKKYSYTKSRVSELSKIINATTHILYMYEMATIGMNAHFVIRYNESGFVRVNNKVYWVTIKI